MEEILSSIKRIIAEEDIPAQGARAPRRAAAASARVTAEEAEADAFADDDQILELTDALPGEAESTHEETVMAFPAKPGSSPKAAKAGRARTTPAAAPAPASEPVAAVMSDTSADAARESLVNLSKLLLKPEDGQANTVEGLVREMLRPMLKDWLDTHLPGLVETMVKREIDRITGRV